MARRRPISIRIRNLILRRLREKERKRRIERYRITLGATKTSRLMAKNIRVIMPVYRSTLAAATYVELIERLGFKPSILERFKIFMYVLLRILVYNILYRNIRLWNDRLKRIRDRIDAFRNLIARLYGWAATRMKPPRLRFMERLRGMYAVDNMLYNETAEVRADIFDKLTFIAKSGYVDPSWLENTTYRFYIRYYVLRYSPWPCRDSSVALKLTPLTIREIAPLVGQVGIITAYWFRKGDLHRIPMLPPTFLLDLLHLILGAYKPPEEIILFRDIGNYDVADPNNYIEIARDMFGRPTARLRIMDAILRPTLITRAYAHVHGAPEEADKVEHCSVYISKRIKSFKHLQWLNEDPRPLLLLAKIKDPFRRKVFWRS